MSVQRIPRGVVALGFVSLFMDVSSEMIHSLLAAFPRKCTQDQCLELGASIIAGGLWSSIGPNATFLVGAAFAVVSGAGLLGAAGWPKKPASM